MKSSTLTFLLVAVTALGTSAEPNHIDPLLRYHAPCISTRNANGQLICPGGEDHYEYNNMKAAQEVVTFEKRDQLERKFKHTLAIEKRDAKQVDYQEKPTEEQGERKGEYLAEIEKVVEDNEVIIFAKNECRWCTKAKNLLREHGIEPTVVNCSLKNADYKADLFAFTGLNTWPQIFIRGTFIGGYTALKELEPHLNQILPSANGDVTEEKSEKGTFNQSEEEAEAPASTVQQPGQENTQHSTSDAPTIPAETLTTPTTTSAAILSKRNPLTPPKWLSNLGHTVARPFHAVSEKIDTYVTAPVKNYIYEPVHSLFSPAAVEVAPFPTDSRPLDIASINSDASSYVTAPETPIFDLLGDSPPPILDIGITDYGRPFLGDFNNLGPSQLELDWNIPPPAEIPAALPAPVEAPRDKGKGREISAPVEAPRDKGKGREISAPVEAPRDKGKGREIPFAATNARMHPKFEVGGPSNSRQENVAPPAIAGGPWISDVVQRYPGPKPKPVEAPAKPAVVAESSKQGAAKPFMLPELNLPGEKFTWSDEELQNVWAISAKENILQSNETPEIMMQKEEKKVQPNARVSENQWTGSMMDRPRGRQIWA